MIWTRSDVMARLEETAGFSRSAGCHLFLRGEKTGITRFANNQITDNQYFADASLTIQAYAGDRSGLATVNQLDRDLLRTGVQRAEEMARRSPADPEYVGPPQTPPIAPSDGYDEASAQASPATRAALVAGVVRECERRGLTAAGYVQTTEEILATHSSAGEPGCFRGTTVLFSVSAKTADGTGSGWVLRWANALSELDIPALGRIAMEKAERSRNPVSFAPGRYTVVLEPVACEFLLYGLTHHFDARSAAEGRNFLCRFADSGQPAGTRVGEQLFSPQLTLTRRVGHPQIRACPFDEQGNALPDLRLVDQGVLANLSFSRYWAKERGVQPTGELRGIQMEGTDQTTADLVRGVKDGILVTRLWYIRDVDWMKSAVTGMTRDGTFRIEGGEIAEPIKNFRFNEELRRVFRDFTAASSAERYWDFLSPGIVVPDFNFTSTTDSI